MNFFIKLITISSLLFFTIGCGDSSTTQTPYTDEPYNDDETSNRQDHGGDMYIIDSSIESPPNIVLYDDTPDGAYYQYQSDSHKGNVLSLYANGLDNQFQILGYDTSEVYTWNELPSYQNRLNISWDGKFNGDFIIFVVLKFQTEDGQRRRDLVYTPSSNGYSDYTDSFMHISLGGSAKDGDWHHFSRDILDDIRRFYPSAKLDYSDNQSGYVNGIAIRGTGKITNIKLGN